jgi:hypothetical protein
MNLSSLDQRRSDGDHSMPLRTATAPHQRRIHEGLHAHNKN